MLVKGKAPQELAPTKRRPRLSATTGRGDDMSSGRPDARQAQTVSAPVSASKRFEPRAVARVAAVTAIALTAANCSSQQVTRNGRSIDPKYGVAASPRVIEDGQPVPKGGGRELVGRPYQVAGRTYVPRENASGYSRVGLASWYGSAFHGRLTANGEIFDRYAVAAAHTTMPLPSYARVTNLENSRSMIVRVNDRGPYHANRLMDVSERVADALDFKRSGTARVRVDYVGRASTRGSDDQKLLATLRMDGSPAPFPGAAPTMVAAAEPAAARPQSVAFFGSQRGREMLDEQDEEAPSARRAAGPAYASAEPVRTARMAIEKDEQAEPSAHVAASAPLPPERPFDLGTIPNAATPIPVAALAPTPPSRPVMAGLFYASPQGPAGARFSKSDPFKDLKSQRVVAFKVTE
jgi:rare lipoprotein A